MDIIEYLKNSFDYTKIAVDTPFGRFIAVEDTRNNPDFTKIFYLHQETRFFQFKGWICSYNGQILTEVKEVKPKQKTVTVYE